MESPRSITVLDTRREDSRPLVTFIVPCFNVEAVVEDTLNSIRNAATGAGIELIVIDDGSSDQTLQRILNTRWVSEMLVLTQQNGGLSHVRNLGASLARGRWLAFLDSDDCITETGFGAMRALAEHPETDVILARTEIFWGRGSQYLPFYDAGLWRQVLGGQDSARLLLREAPLLLAFEPNMNYRWIRRSFYLSERISFPEGLFFEDAPAHFQMLLSAKCIALTSEVYYLYRVGRVGKITEERGQRRFDVIPVLKLSVEMLQKYPLSPSDAFGGLRVLFRLCWGCGTMVPLVRRYEFFSKAVRALDGIPSSWIRSYLDSLCIDQAHRVLGYLISQDLASVLFLVSIGHSLKVMITGLRHFFEARVRALPTPPPPNL